MEDGALLEFKLTGLRTVHLRAGQITGQQVGGELQAVKIAFDTVGQFLDGRGLGQTGGTFYQ